jgi:hypothetical protein
MIFKTVNLDGLTYIQNIEVPLQVVIETWFNNIQNWRFENGIQT